MSGRLRLYSSGDSRIWHLTRAARDAAAASAGQASDTVADRLARSGNLSDVTDPEAATSNLSVRAARPGALLRALSDKVSETVTARDYGAAPDGSADARPAINAALAAAPGDLILPPGTYSVASKDGFRGITMPSARRLIGQGAGATYIVPDPAVGAVHTLSLTDVDGALLQGFRVGQASAGAGMRFQDSQGVTVRDVTIEGGPGYAVGLFWQDRTKRRADFTFDNITITSPSGDAIDSKSDGDIGDGNGNDRFTGMHFTNIRVTDLRGGPAIDNRMQAHIALSTVYAPNLALANGAHRARRSATGSTYNQVYAYGPGPLVTGPAGLFSLAARVATSNYVAQDFASGFVASDIDGVAENRLDDGQQVFVNCIADNCNVGARIQVLDAQFTNFVAHRCTTGILVRGSAQVIRAIFATPAILSGLYTQEGAEIRAGDAVLVTAQADPVQNGLYIAAEGTWSRSPQAQAWRDVFTRVWVPTAGTYLEQVWESNVPATGTVGVDPIFYRLARRGSRVHGAVLRSSGVGATFGVDVRSGFSEILDFDCYGYNTGVRVGPAGLGTKLRPGAFVNCGVDIDAQAPIYIDWGGNQPRKSVAANATLLHGDVGRLIEASPGGSDITLTMPAAGLEGRLFYIRKISSSAGRVIVSTGAATIVRLAVQDDAATIRDTGSAWVLDTLTPATRQLTASVLPDATELDGRMVLVSDGDDGDPCIAVARDGAWRRIPLGAIVEPAYRAASIALFDAMVTPPTLRRKLLIDTLIGTLTDAGVWARLGGLWLWAAETQQAARLNWVAPAGTAATEVDSPTWVADRGYVGNGSGWVDTGFAWGAGLGVAQNDASMALLFHLENAAAGTALGGLVGGTLHLQFQRGSGGVPLTRINSNTSGSPVGAGLLIPVLSVTSAVLSRSTSTEHRVVVNGIGETVSTVSTPLQTGNFAAMRNVALLLPAGPRVIGQAAGASLTDEQAVVLSNALSAYAAGIGA